MSPLFAEITAVADVSYVGALVEIVTRLGLPVALLFVVLRYHVRVVLAKDLEIQRISELRVKEAANLGDAMLKRDREFLEIMGETNQTLALFEQRFNKSS